MKYTNYVLSTLLILVLLTGCSIGNYGTNNDIPSSIAKDGEFLKTTYCLSGEKTSGTERLDSELTAYDYDSIKYSCQDNEAEFAVITPKTLSNEELVQEIIKNTHPDAESVSAETEKVVQIISNDIVMLLWYNDKNIYLLSIDAQILQTEPNGMQELLDSYLAKYPSIVNIQSMKNYIRSLPLKITGPEFLPTDYCSMTLPVSNTESLTSGTSYDLTSVKYVCKNNTEAEFAIIYPNDMSSKSLAEQFAREYKPNVDSVSAEFEKVIKVISEDVLITFWYDANKVYLFKIDRVILDTEPNGMQQLFDSYLAKYPSIIDRDQMNTYINSI